MITVLFIMLILVVCYMAAQSEEDRDWLDYNSSRYFHRLGIMNELGSTEDGGVKL